MKFLVDKLPFYGEYCPFYENCLNNDTSNCPRCWDKYDIEDREHECCWLKEYKDDREVKE